MRCSSCNHDNRADRRFCAECGAALAAGCTSCGVANQPGEKFCGGCGIRLPTEGPALAVAPPTREPEAALPAGERRQLTVLFCDLVGSTPLSQQLDAEEWRDVVEAYHRTAAAAVTRFGGHVAQYLGDGLLIYFGWPTAREDDPERAIRAGLAILDAMVPLNATLDVGTHLAVRIGMHTGPVVIGDGGAVFGETANVAARVQSAAEPDTLMITAAAQRLVAGMFVVEDRGPQALKGMREPVTLYRVVEPSGVRSRLDVAAGRLTRFVGRDLELGTLVDRWERAAGGEGQTVLLLGEAGVGKSRLAYQLRERLGAVPHTWLECGATPYTEGTPFFPVIELVAQGLTFTPEDSTAEKVRKIERGLNAVGIALAEAVPLMADFLGLPPAEAYAPLRMSPDLQRRKTMELLTAWYLALGGVQPLVLLMEDLHWADPSSLDLLGRLFEQSPTARVLCIGTARPEFTAPWPARSHLTTLQLARLTKRQAREMVVGLGAGTLATDMVETLVARADGVPLYVEELTKAVAEPGVTRGVEAIPATLADSLMARLDRLSTAKEIAQRAAVLGREFTYGLLAAVVGLEEAALRQGLARLIEAEILFVRGEPPTATYTFKHALVQEAAYGSLLRRTRQQLHGRVVDVLVQRFPDRVAAEPAVAARHAEAAGRTDEAITYYRRAGEHAQARSAHGEAIQHLRWAIDLLASLPASGTSTARELGLQLALVPSLAARRGYAHAETESAYTRTRDLAEAGGDAAQLGSALYGLSVVHQTRAELTDALALAERVLALGEQSRDEVLVSGGHMAIANVKYWQGHFAPALEHCDQVLARCDAVDHRRLGSVTEAGVNALAFGAWCLHALGWPQRALSRAADAVARAHRLGDPFGLAFALMFETTLHWDRRDMDHQREGAGQLIALSEAQGFPLWLGMGRALHAAARAVVAADASAAAASAEGLALAAGTGNRAGAPASFRLLAETQQAVRHLTDALGTVEAGIAVAAETGGHCYDADLQRLKGDLLLAVGEQDAVEQAETLFRRALAIARTQEAKSFELRAATSLAGLLRAQGRGLEARELLAPLYAWFTEGFATRDLQAAKALLDDLG